MDSSKIIWDKFFYSVSNYGGGITYNGSSRRGGHWEIKLGDSVVSSDHPTTQDIFNCLINFEANQLLIQRAENEARRIERENRRMNTDNPAQQPVSSRGRRSFGDIMSDEHFIISPDVRVTEYNGTVGLPNSIVSSASPTTLSSSAIDSWARMVDHRAHNGIAINTVQYGEYNNDQSESSDESE